MANESDDIRISDRIKKIFGENVSEESSEEESLDFVSLSDDTDDTDDTDDEDEPCYSSSSSCSSSLSSSSNHSNSSPPRTEPPLLDIDPNFDPENSDFQVYLRMVAKELEEFVENGGAPPKPKEYKKRGRKPKLGPEKQKKYRNGEVPQSGRIRSLSWPELTEEVKTVIVSLVMKCPEMVPHFRIIIKGFPFMKDLKQYVGRSTDAFGNQMQPLFFRTRELSDLARLKKFIDKIDLRKMWNIHLSERCTIVYHLSGMFASVSFSAARIQTAITDEKKPIDERYGDCVHRAFKKALYDGMDVSVDDINRFHTFRYVYFSHERTLSDVIFTPSEDERKRYQKMLVIAVPVSEDFPPQKTLLVKYYFRKNTSFNHELPLCTANWFNVPAVGSIHLCATKLSKAMKTYFSDLFLIVMLTQNN